MSEEPCYKAECFLHGGTFEYGPHLYRGRKVRAYEIMICDLCDSANWDGIAPHLEEKLEAHLEKKKIRLPKRNKNGLYPLPPKGC